MSGYFFDASNDGGLTIQPCTFVLPVDAYQISSVSVHVPGDPDSGRQYEIGEVEIGARLLPRNAAGHDAVDLIAPWQRPHSVSADVIAVDPVLARRIDEDAAAVEGGGDVAGLERDRSARAGRSIADAHGTTVVGADAA